MSKRAEAAAYNYAKEKGTLGHDYNQIYDAAKNGYEQAEKDLGWISVKDRLPEVGHFVLTCVSDAGTPQCVGMALLLEDGTWWDGDIKVHVDYWMEVPKLKEKE